MKYMKIILTVLILIPLFDILPQENGYFSIARLKYSGGGDWYNDPSSEENLLKFVADRTNIKVNPEYQFVELSSDDIFSHPFLFLTGHGNVVFSGQEADRLRRYLEAGGFLYIDDDYSLDKAVRREMKKVFPEKNLVEIPFNYGLYHCFYEFPYGPPKTHEHDDKNPKGYGIFIGDRLAVYYTYESNPADGWADERVHNDSPEKREEALKFGLNLIVWVLSN